MRIENILGKTVLVFAGLLVSMVFATPRYAAKESLACAVCHANVAGGEEMTDNGKIYKEKHAFDKKPDNVEEGRRATYIGVNKCKMCHMKTYKSWLTTPHAGAFKILVDKASDKKEECVACHTTGSGLIGGFAIATADEQMKNVTCEGCHGPGSLHKSAAKEDRKKFINTKITESYCISCHNKEQSPKFDYKEYVKKGLHEIEKK